MTRVGLVGLGLIGAERLTAIRSLAARFPEARLELVGTFEPGVPHPSVDAPPKLFGELSGLIAAAPDLAVVAVPHDVAGEITSTLLGSGIRVHVEKPLGRTGLEARAISQNATRASHLTVGFNYRFLPGVAALLEDASFGWFGDLISVNMSLGHGGAPGDEGSWKLDPIRAGGGCLIDPGVHFLDIAMLLAGRDLEVVGGSTWSGFWNTGIEEEAKFILTNSLGTMLSIDLSVVRWRSTFRIEVHGNEGYGIVQGRNRSYGPQEYRRGHRGAWRSGCSQAESEELVVASSGADSFADELRSVLGLGEPTTTTVCSADEACHTMDLLDRVRESISGDVTP